MFIFFYERLEHLAKIRHKISYEIRFCLQWSILRFLCVEVYLFKKILWLKKHRTFTLDIDKQQIDTTIKPINSKTIETQITEKHFTHFYLKKNTYMCIEGKSWKKINFI